MLFSSPLFLFAFFPAFLAAYFLLPRRFQNTVLLGASLFFYSWAEPRFVFVVLISALFDYLLGRGIHALPSDRESPPQRALRRRGLLTLGIVSNLGLLVYFKYANFFLSSVDAAFRTLHLHPFPLLEIALPVGISFIVFEKITYLVDLYRGTGIPARHLTSYLLYVFFFPKLLAGPIIKYHDIAPQLEKRTVTLDDVVYGMTRFCLGLAKKLLLADALGGVADHIFAMPNHAIGTRNAWLGLICFTLQIFFDFSGYSDMAIGMARVVGFRLMENFNSPYIAANFTEFWRRWHISLSTWIREYLYIPLGGNRISVPRTYLNLWLCFFASGLWHGARWTFVLWGAYQGTFMALDKLFWLNASKRLPHLVNVALCFFFVMLGWVLFRAQRFIAGSGLFRVALSP